MPLEPPSTLSPSKIAAFTDCALAFRYSAIDHLPEPPTVATSRGTLVHAALERLFLLDADLRTPERAVACLAEAAEAFRADPEFTDLGLDAGAQATFLADAERLVLAYFRLEDPRHVNPIGLELLVAAEVGGVTLRGIIDRLELDADGELVVTDYKTGRAPTERFEQGRLEGVHIYALLCEKLFGRRPAAIRLLYLADPVEIRCIPSAQQGRHVERKVGAIWQAVERACARDDFRPRPSRLCDFCAFRSYCPAVGGDPSLAVGTPHRRDETLAAVG